MPHKFIPRVCPAYLARPKPMHELTRPAQCSQMRATKAIMREREVWSVTFAANWVPFETCHFGSAVVTLSYLRCMSMISRLTLPPFSRARPLVGAVGVQACPMTAQSRWAVQRRLGSAGGMMVECWLYGLRSMGPTVQTPASCSTNGKGGRKVGMCEPPHPFAAAHRRVVCLPRIGWLWSPFYGLHGRWGDTLDVYASSRVLPSPGGHESR